MDDDTNSLTVVKRRPNGSEYLMTIRIGDGVHTESELTNYGDDGFAGKVVSFAIDPKRPNMPRKAVVKAPSMMKKPIPGEHLLEDFQV
jgi:hypothetical protein